jgi:endonuclease YncB( thermonuclease family)
LSRHFKRPWQSRPSGQGYSPLRGPRRPLWAFLGILGMALASWLSSKPFGPQRYQDQSVGDVSGRATAIDGDSLRLGSQELRMRGIDAPEGRQDCQRNGQSWPCGREAASALRRLVEAGPITCRIERQDQHNRGLAVCRRGEIDLNAAMVSEGWAVAFDRGADALYKREEQQARRERRGIWQGEFTPPQEWRRQNGIGGR